MFNVADPSDRGGLQVLLLTLFIDRTVVNPYAGEYKMMQQTWKIRETLANGCLYESTHRDLSTEYQHDRV